MVMITLQDSAQLGIAKKYIPVVLVDCKVLPNELQ